MFYSQKSYPNTKLGTCSDTIAQSGCFMTSFCNLLHELGIAEIDPIVFNKKAFPNGGCMANAGSWANLYNLQYLKSAIKPSLAPACIAETDHWKSVGVPQHFFLWRPDGKIVDPLDAKPDWKENTKYGIVSYRLFAPKIPIKTEQTPKIETPVPAPKIDTKIEMVNVPVKTLEQVAQEAPAQPTQGGIEPAIAPEVITEYDKASGEIKTAPTYQDLTSPKNQFQEALSSLWNLIKLIFKIK